MIGGIITALLLAAFLAISFWAWAGYNRASWHAASLLPLEDEPAPRNAPYQQDRSSTELPARAGGCCCGAGACGEQGVRP